MNGAQRRAGCAPIHKLNAWTVTHRSRAIPLVLFRTVHPHLASVQTIRCLWRKVLQRDGYMNGAQRRAGCAPIHLRDPNLAQRQPRRLLSMPAIQHCAAATPWPSVPPSAGAAWDTSRARRYSVELHSDAVAMRKRVSKNVSCRVQTVCHTRRLHVPKLRMHVLLRRRP